jgi:peroxisomal 2,4-dienoyl-CoA reductase
MPSPEVSMSVFRQDVFAGQVAMVTGGGSGIGKGIAEAFAAHGAKVVITSRNLERLEAAAAEIREKTGAEVLVAQADVRDADQVTKAVALAIEKFGRIDTLVNGAAGTFLAPAAALSVKGYRTVLDIDAVGTFAMSRAVFDAWMRDHGGNIINISATLQYQGTPWQIHAASAKAAIDVQTKTLAIEWGPIGIRVNAVAPGPIDGTEGMARLAPGEQKAKLTNRIPLRRFGEIGEIADCVLFLASPASKWTTGSVFIVDGGQWLTGWGMDV